MMASGLLPEETDASSTPPLAKKMQLYRSMGLVPLYELDASGVCVLSAMPFAFFLGRGSCVE